MTSLTSTHLQDVAPVAQAPVASGSPVSTGTLCDTLPDAIDDGIYGPATPAPSLPAPMVSI